MLTEAATPKLVFDVTKELMDQFFPGVSIPTFKVLNHTAPRTLGVCRYRSDRPETTLIEIQKSILDDEDTLRRVLAHELIHHWQYMTTDMEKQLRLKRLRMGEDFHGESFEKKAAEINAVYGKDFVTKKSDETYKVTASTKEFYVLIAPSKSRVEELGEYSFATVIRPSARQKEIIKDRIEHMKAKLFKTNDQSLHGTSVSDGMGKSRDKGIQAKIKDMYENGSPVMLESFEESVDEFGVPTMEDVSKWDTGVWVHYSKIPEVKINPQQFHQDPVGIYLFPESFKAEGSWFKMPYKFRVKAEVSNTLDLAALSKKEAIELFKAMVPEEFHSVYISEIEKAKEPIDVWWDMLKNYFVLSKTAPGKAAWNKAFQSQGYDSIFDDTGSIFGNEVQLLVLDPRKVKVIERIDQGSTGYEEVKEISAKLAELLQPYGEVSVEEPKTDRSWGKANAKIVGKVSVENGDKGLEWAISPTFIDKKDAVPDQFSVSLKSGASELRRQMSRGVTLQTNKRPWDYKDLENEVKKVAMAEFGDKVESLDEVIKHEGSKWVVRSHKGKNLGTYDTKKEAEKRLRQVEFFKHQGESLDQFGIPMEEAKPVSTIKASEELEEFYYMADRRENEQQWADDAEEEFNNMSDEDIDEHILWYFEDANWDHDEYLQRLKKMSPADQKKERLSHFIAQYVASREEDEPTTLVYFEKPRILGKTVLYRFTHSKPDEILKNGFDGHGPNNLGLTAQGGGGIGSLAFAFEKKDLKSKKDIKDMSWKYGKNLFQFTVPYAVKVYHNTDYEDQVVFDVETVSGLKFLGEQQGGVVEGFDVDETGDAKYDASVKGAFDFLEKQKAWIPEGKVRGDDLEDAWNVFLLKTGDDLEAEDNPDSDHMKKLRSEWDKAVSKAKTKKVNVSDAMNWDIMDHGRRPKGDHANNPIVVGKSGNEFHVLDGAHRVFAADERGDEKIEALILDLDWADLVLFEQKAWIPESTQITNDDVIEFFDSITDHSESLDNQHYDIDQWVNWKLGTLPISMLDFSMKNVSEPASRDLMKSYARMETAAPPIIVVPSEAETGKFRIVDGYHRVGVAVKNGAKEVEAYYPSKDLVGESVVEVDVPWNTTVPPEDRVANVFVNPTPAQLSKCLDDDHCRAFVTKDKLIVWPITDALHANVAESLKLGDDAVSLYLYGRGTDVAAVTVTDWTEGTKWHHSLEVKEYVLNNPKLEKFLDSDVEFGYYDEDIVGDWSELTEDSDTKSDMADWFACRTTEHIRLVRKYLDKIILLGLPEINTATLEAEKDHDASKWLEPEYEPYLHVSWKYRQKDLGKEYKPAPEIEAAMHDATFHHVTNNKHHPEYWDDAITQDSLNPKNRDEPSGRIVDATEMPLDYIAVMIADWLAMSEEKGTSVQDWMKKNVNIRWKFTPEQVDMIERLCLFVPVEAD